MRDVLESAASVWSDLGLVEIRLAETLILIGLLVVARSMLSRVVNRRVQDVHARYHWNKALSYAATLIGILLVGRIWFVGFRSVATFMGLVAAGLVISLKEPVMNMAGWAFLLWRRPFVVGDRIQVGEHAGDVIDRRLFQFSILEVGNWVDADQSTGRIIHIPNGRLFTEPQANYTKAFPYLWNEVSVTITFESNWREAKRLLLEVGERHRMGPELERQVLARSDEYPIFYSTLAPAVYTRGGEYGIVLTLRYMCGARQRRGTEQVIWEDLLDAISARDDIDIAYRTQRFFDRSTEVRTLRRAEPDLS
ncbi:MAG TPA: mechanosensitive ion channel family protein [Longimicrobiales bacterium]|nr:mechanosensitive ion channel family protein [Longimicrobiales bacterium]